jgi:hypothetical protein
MAEDLEDGGGFLPDLNLNGSFAYLVVCGYPVVLFECV